MRSSYYSDTRFKRSSLAHELCSKIEVTPGPGSPSYRDLPSNPSLSLSLSLAQSPPLPQPFYPVNSMLPPSPKRSSILSPPLSLLLFRRYIFCSDRERSVGRSVGRFELRAMVFLIVLSSSISLPSKRCVPLPPPLHNPSPPREFVDYNKCVCSSRRRYRKRRVVSSCSSLSFPSSLSASSSPRFAPLPPPLRSLSLSRARLPISRPPPLGRRTGPMG